VVGENALDGRARPHGFASTAMRTGPHSLLVLQPAAVEHRGALAPLLDDAVEPKPVPVDSAARDHRC
jgi:hypothetical protein